MVTGKKLEIVWSPSAKKDLRKAYIYIKKNSKSSAKKVRDSIIEEIEKLASHPKVFELDRFKNDNTDGYRAFEQFHYRVAYKHTETELHVLRVRHTSREPLDY